MHTVCPRSLDPFYIVVTQIREDNSDKNHDGPNNINDGVPRLLGVLPLVAPSVVARVEPLPLAGRGDVASLSSHTL